MFFIWSSIERHYLGLQRYKIWLEYCAVKFIFHWIKVLYLRNLCEKLLEKLYVECCCNIWREHTFQWSISINLYIKCLKFKLYTYFFLTGNWKSTFVISTYEIIPLHLFGGFKTAAFLPSEFLANFSAQSAGSRLLPLSFHLRFFSLLNLQSSFVDHKLWCRDGFPLLFSSVCINLSVFGKQNFVWFSSGLFLEWFKFSEI